ncbi:hypothetical protein EG339_15890 [Chryseobacterium bernardetii]|uniref:Uncharacterized protein n=1 Tax=Chryseobacterium bernardetii TaxID=1241978 RepID=A0A3G6T9P5_9FLAO|nr:hypothetical protein EG339_15890 [Chryseobacterium bernardetii]
MNFLVFIKFFKFYQSPYSFFIFERSRPSFVNSSVPLSVMNITGLHLNLQKSMILQVFYILTS